MKEPILEVTARIVARSSATRATYLAMLDHPARPNHDLSSLGVPSSVKELPLGFVKLSRFKKPKESSLVDSPALAIRLKKRSSSPTQTSRQLLRK